MTLYDESLFVDRDTECRGFAKLLQAGTKRAGMLLTADEKMGKSWLISKLYRQSQAAASDVPICYLDFRHPREKYQMQDMLGLVRLIRDKLEQPSYFNRLNATINRFMESTPSGTIRAVQRLTDKICEYFNLEELKSLARYLDIDPESLPRDIKPAFASELVSYHVRRGLLPKLIAELQRENPRPDVNWQEDLDRIVNVGDVAGATGTEMIADARGNLKVSSDKELQNAEFEISAAFFACLSDLVMGKHACILLVDHYDEASPEAQRWIREQLLTSVRDEKLRNLVIIISGRQIPRLAELGLDELLETRELPPLKEEDIREYWLERRKAPVLEGVALEALPQTLATLSGGIPGELAKMADRALARSQKKDSLFEDG
jgi:hypothetical protein